MLHLHCLRKLHFMLDSVCVFFTSWSAVRSWYCIFHLCFKDKFNFIYTTFTDTLWNNMHPCVIHILCIFWITFSGLVCMLPFVWTFPVWTMLSTWTIDNNASSLRSWAFIAMTLFACYSLLSAFFSLVKHRHVFSRNSHKFQSFLRGDSWRVQDCYTNYWQTVCAHFPCSPVAMSSP